MDEYITKQTAKNAVILAFVQSSVDINGAIAQNVVKAIRNAHSDAVHPVIKGEISNKFFEEDGEWQCSICKEQFTICQFGKDRTNRISYCPYCGSELEYHMMNTQ